MPEETGETLCETGGYIREEMEGNMWEIAAYGDFLDLV